jgi:hypothetical protein
MSTWTSKVRLAGALAAGLALLAGCFETEALGRAGTRANGNGPGSVGVLDGTVTVAGPDGFCVDQTATRESGGHAFVLMRRCRAGRGPAPVLSVTVTDLRLPEGDRAEQLDGLAAFLATDAGRGQLSRRGRASDVAIGEIEQREGALWMFVTDTGNPAGFEAGYWRVVMPLAGRLVTLSAMSLQETPISPADGAAAMADLVAILRQRNLD